jgi:hypothetical protein
MADQIICPKCQTKITITQALASQLARDLEEKYKKQLAAKQAEFAQQQKLLTDQKQAIKKQQTDLQEIIDEKVEKQAQAAKKELWQKAQEKAGEKLNLQFKALQEELDDRKKENEELTKKELGLIKQKRKLDEDKRKMELQVARKIEQERKILSEKIEKEMSEQMRLKFLEKEKQLTDTQKALEEAQRKAKQGSQQNQGEVLELDLEETLAKTFPRDQIEPVGKGVSGADIIQKVCQQNGKTCGVILWEIKQTKHWTEGWVIKFKDDLRAQKANIPVLVTTSLPKEIEGFGFYKGIWVSLPKMAVSLAIALRKQILSTAFERAAAAGKGEKAELLYSYVSSHEFRQRVEALVEVFSDMQGQIIKERTAFEKSWKAREGQMQRLMLNVAGMYGEMQGLVGSTMPEIKGLELGDEPKQLNKENEQKLF